MLGPERIHEIDALSQALWRSTSQLQSHFLIGHLQCAWVSFQALAQLRSSQERREEALELLRQSTVLWLGQQGKEEEVAGDAMHEDGDDDADGQPAAETAAGLHAARPPYGFRVETAKLLLDLDATTAAAEEVLLFRGVALSLGCPLVAQTFL